MIIDGQSVCLITSYCAAMELKALVAYSEEGFGSRHFPRATTFV